MSSVSNTKNPEVTENHTSTLPETFESDYILDENEAKEINSCLNFLSILDEESSNDSCEFTLFRKKEDVTEHCKEKESESSDICLQGVELNLNVNKVDESEVQKQIVKKNDSANKTCGKTKLLGNTPEKIKSPNFRIRSTSPKIFKISSVSKRSFSKNETKSLIQSANNIVLKVPQFTTKSKSSSPHKNEADIKCVQNAKSNQEMNIEIKCKPLNTVSKSLKMDSQNVIKKNKAYYSECNGMVPDKIKKYNIVLKKNSNNINEVTEWTNVSCNSNSTLDIDKNLKEKSAYIINNKDKSVPTDSEVYIESKSCLIQGNPVITTSTPTESTTEDSMCESVTNRLKCQEITPVTNSPKADGESVPNNEEPVEQHNQVVLDNPTLHIDESPVAEIEMLKSNIQSKNKKAKVKVISKKNVRTRIRKGIKSKNRMTPIRDLTKSKFFWSLKKSTSVATDKKEKMMENKYKPLPRMGLPTFLNKLDSPGNDPSSLLFPAATNPVTEQVESNTNKPKTMTDQMNDGISKPKSVTESKESDTTNKSTHNDEMKGNTVVSSQCNALGNNQSKGKMSENKSCRIMEPESSVKPSRLKEHSIIQEKKKGNVENYSINSQETSVQDLDLHSAQNMGESTNTNLLLNTEDVKINNFLTAQTSNENYFVNNCNIENEENTDSQLCGPEKFKALPLDEDTMDATETCFSDDLDNHTDGSLFFTPSIFKDDDAPSVLPTEETRNLFSSNTVENLENENKESEHLVTENFSEDSTDTNEELSQDSTSTDPRVSGIVYSYNKSSPLSFCVQNILEHMFKHESFPSSTNMARLAKLMKVQWKDVRDWFVARRHLNKKNGIFSRDQALTSCPYCPQYQFSANEVAMVHLLTKEHIQNINSFMEKDTMIFSKFQAESKKDEEKESDILNPSSLGREEGLATPKITPPLSESRLPPTTALQDQRERWPKTGNRKASFLRPQLKKKVDTLKRNYQKKSDNYFKVPDPPAPKVPVPPDLNADVKKQLKKWRSLRPADSKIYVGYRCPDCAKIFQSEWMLIRHCVSHRKLICSECNEVFLREDLLQHHFKKHLIESMDAKLYSMYLCFKCFNLNCVCVQDSHYIPNVRTKHYLRPQTAKRSKPFHSLPYSGTNEDLKVTINEFWDEFKLLERNSLRPNKEKTSNEVQSSLQKQDKNDNKNMESNITPTYTNITTFNCDICESFFFTQDELKEHVIVHRIQARSRNKKRQEKEREDEEKREESSEFLKPSAPIDPFYFCSYCTKGYKKDKSLKKHLKVECKSLPKNIAQGILEGNSFDIEKAGKGNHYKVKLKPVPAQSHVETPALNPASDPSESVSRTPASFDHPPKTSNLSTTESLNTLKHKSKPSSKVQGEKHERFYFFCRYCGLPLSSEQLHSHISRTCSKAPDKMKSDIAPKAARLKHREGIHYYKIDKKEAKPIKPKMIKYFFDTSTFPSLKTNYKRMKCKFCDKHSLTSCLKLHLLKQCKNVPEEIRILLVRNKNSLPPNKFKQNPSPNKSNLVHENETLPFENNQMRKTDEPCATSPKQTISCSPPLPPTATKPNLLYDCHLCEEKFNMSKDFISHMSNFHCMTISEYSSSKWLSDVNAKYEKESPSKSPEKGVDAKWLSCTSKDEKESPFKTPDKHVGEKIDPDVNLESVAETLVVADYVKESNVEVPLRAAKRRRGSSASSSTTESPGKSQKMEEDDLLGDIDNLDSFIETVQLEDSTFVDSL